MKRIRIHEYDDYIVELTDDEYEDLQNGNVGISELLEEKQKEDKAYWKNGATDYWEV